MQHISENMAAKLLTVQLNENKIFKKNFHCIMIQRLNFGIRCKSVYTWVNSLEVKSESTELE